jgi:DNA polymerase-1
MDIERLTNRLNAPVQDTGADGLKLALALLWEQRTECPRAVPVIVCHDEIVVECDAEQATVAKAWLERAMTEGMDTVLTYAVEPGYRLARGSSLQSLGT